MTFFFVFQLAFSTYPCCWKEKWKKFKKIWTIWGIFGKILVRSDPGKLQASRKKNRKKSEKKAPLTAFVERYLFGEIGNKFRCREGIIGKNGKNQKTVPQFSEFLERYLLGMIRGKYRLPERKIKKSLKKSDDFQIFLEDTWWRQRCINDGNDNFLQKSSKKFPQWDNFWKDTCSETTGISAGS